MVTTLRCACPLVQVLQQQDGLKCCFHMTLHVRSLFRTLQPMILHAVGRRQIAIYTKFIESPTLDDKRGFVLLSPSEKQRLLKSNAKAIALFAHLFATKIMKRTISELLSPPPDISGKAIGKSWVFASVT